MRSLTLLASIGFAASLAGCMSIPSTMSVAEYCANPDKANENVCRLKVKIDGNSTALTDTNMSLNKARMIANSALSTANTAQASADAAMGAASRAQGTANNALSLARSAMLEDDLTCKTNTIRNSKVGTCEPGYTVMGCSQTRYTTRAGGLSFLREVNSEQCRFNSRVLEMQVRCCTAGSVQTQISYPTN